MCLFLFYSNICTNSPTGGKTCFIGTNSCSVVDHHMSSQSWVRSNYCRSSKMWPRQPFESAFVKVPNIRLFFFQTFVCYFCKTFQTFACCRFPLLAFVRKRVFFRTSMWIGVLPNLSVIFVQKNKLYIYKMSLSFFTGKMHMGSANIANWLLRFWSVFGILRED